MTGSDFFAGDGAVNCFTDGEGRVSRDGTDTAPVEGFERLLRLALPETIT